MIHDTALELGLGPAAAVVGIATALQESDLGADPRARIPDSNGDIGLFQMRTHVGWHANADTVAGNIAILLDDTYQTRVFFLGHTTLGGWHIPGLVDIPNWRNLPISEAAQAVQVSAHPNAYAKHEPTARTLVAQFTTDPGTAGPCPTTPGMECPALPDGVGSEEGQTPDAIRVMRCVAAMWPQIRTIGGLRPGDPKDHGTGRAADIMIPNWHTPAGQQLGQEIAHWARTNATALGITYVIWDRTIWSPARDGEGWRPCSLGSCYNGPNPSAAHEDHVHISVHGHTQIPADRAGGVVLPIAKGSYRLTARYGQGGPHWRATHTGLDFAAPTGTPIQAITSGRVIHAHNTGAYGNLTKIQTPDGTQIWYAHQHQIHVTTGQHITAGQTIGTVGSTGNSTAPHLHIEIRVHGAPTDPDAWLRSHGLDP